MAENKITEDDARDGENISLLEIAHKDSLKLRVLRKEIVLNEWLKLYDAASSIMLKRIYRGCVEGNEKEIKIHIAQI